MCTASNDILVFLVGLGQSGAESGLGISVKGKTSVSDACYRDLGLYVKSILDDGAAAKVQRSALLFALHTYQLCYIDFLQCT